VSPPPETAKGAVASSGKETSGASAQTAVGTPTEKKDKVVVPKLGAASAKRKLVGQDETKGDKKEEVPGQKKKKKSKPAKGLLSFDEAEGE